jgi:YfiR/HmsC-like
VLTISDLDGFIAQGGVAQFFFDQGRLRFSVQLEAARRARLQISSRLLTLAKQP